MCACGIARSQGVLHLIVRSVLEFLALVALLLKMPDVHKWFSGWCRSESA